MSVPPTDEPEPVAEPVRATMSVRGATFLGIGSMVGAGIFALLGEAGAVAGAAVWISFLLAGIVAGLLGYTVVKLGVRYPSSGGLIAYLVAGFGKGRLVGIASWLGYVSAIVIVGAMVAVSFGSYATSLFVGRDAAAGWDNVFTSFVVLLTLGINMMGSRLVDRAQSAIVLIELAVFTVFIVVTVGDADWSLLAFSGYPSVSDIVASVALTFFAFLGFSVISFSVGDLRDPAHGLPRAMSGAIGITAALYVLIALGVFGTLSVTDVTRYGETAIAEAARPALGETGFVMMALAAVLATASSLNATLYASGGLTRSLAAVRPVPRVLRAPRDRQRARRAAAHRRDRAGDRQPRRPLGHRLGRQRDRARRVRPRRDRGLAAPVRDGREHGPHGRGDRGRRDRARLLRGRHVAERPRDVRGDPGDRPARRPARLPDHSSPHTRCREPRR